MGTKANIGAKITLEGEKEYRQAISSVSKSMNVLKSDLKAVSAEYADNANSLEALRVKNEVLTKQQTEQEKKLSLLRGALESVTQTYGENSKQAQDWQIKLNNAYSELTKINKELGENEKYMKEAGKSTDKTAKSIDQFGKEVKSTKDETLKFGDVLKANLASDAIVNGVQMLADKARDLAVAMVDVVKSTASYADNIMVMSTNTGISTDTLQELNYMAELTDTSLETITSTMEKNIRSMNSAKQGTTNFANAYKELGIQITGSNGELRNSQDVFWDAVDALGRMSNETERDALAMTIFGKSAQDLNSLIAIGSDGVAKFAEEARNMGAVLSKDTLEGLGQTDDAIQRMVQQIEISKRTIGAEMAPAMTESITKITEKIGEVDDKVADFAGGSLNAMTDGFLWLVDNIDVVVAGLKGVAAGLITKKAADGITYAVQAYKTLTTATEAATVAQEGFNVASKANVIGAIAAVVVGLTASLYSYAKSSYDAAEETRKLNDESLKLLETSKELQDEVASNVDGRKKSAEAMSSEYEAAKKLADSLYNLASKENKSSSEKSQMIALVKQLNEEIPDLNLVIDEQTGLLNKQYGQVQDLINAELELQRVRTAGEQIAQIELDRVNQQKALNDLLESQSIKQQEQVKLAQEYSEAAKIASYSEWGISSTSLVKSSELTRVNGELETINQQVEESKKKLNELNSEYDTVMEYIGDHSPAEAAASSIDNLIEQYKNAMQTNADDAINTVDDAVETINDIYDDASEKLQDRFDDEQDALEKSQEKQVKAVEAAQEKELKAAEKAHNKKLKLIDEEYLEKIKLVDEDRYNALKTVQDKIDAIDTQQNAEDLAAKDKEEAEKRAELKSKIENAKTIEDKLQAQKDLADFEEDIAADRRKTERDLQKDILENQKDTINEAYDKKVDKIEKAKEKAIKAADAEYENDKKDIQKSYDLKLETLKDIQEEEKKSLDKRQREYKKYLGDQKDLAIKNAKDIYEEDLRQFKLNNALKSSGVSESELFGKLKEQAIRNLYSGKDIENSQKILNAKTLDEMLKYYNPSSSLAEMKTATFDYAQMGTELTKALKNLKLTVVLNGKTVGSIIENRVNEMAQ